MLVVWDHAHLVGAVRVHAHVRCWGFLVFKGLDCFYCPLRDTVPYGASCRNKNSIPDENRVSVGEHACMWRGHTVD